MKVKSDLGLVGRIAENLAMGVLVAASRPLVSISRVRRSVQATEHFASRLLTVSPLRPYPDILPRGRALAYRWSAVVPGANCLHRALATRVWLAARRVDSTVVVGFRKRAEFEGHAWLEVPLGGATTLVFVSDDDGWEPAFDSGTTRAA